MPRPECSLEKIAHGVREHCRKDNAAADEASFGRQLGKDEQGKQRREWRFGRSEQAGFGGRNQARSLRGQDRGERKRQSKKCENDEVACRNGERIAFLKRGWITRATLRQT